MILATWDMVKATWVFQIALEVPCDHETAQFAVEAALREQAAEEPSLEGSLRVLRRALYVAREEKALRERTDRG